MISLPGRAEMRRAALRMVGPAVSALGRGLRADDRTGELRGPRVLLIRPDHLGDTLLAAPATRVLRSALPGAQIDWLVGPWSADIIRRCGDADEVLTLPFPAFTRTPKQSPAEPYGVLWSEAARLRRRRYDAAVILRPDHWWGAMLVAAAGIPRRFGYGVSECLPFLTDTLPVPTGRQGHAVLMNQRLARLAAVRLSGRSVARDILDPTFPIEDADHSWARDWLARRVADRSEGAVANELTRDEAASGRLVIIHPGSGARLKNWPPGRWADVARGLASHVQARIVLTGGPAEREILRAVAADPTDGMLVAEGTTVGQLAALFAGADLVLGGDSGPLHLAAAVGTPTVRVYGPTDTQEFGPWPPSPLHGALVAGLPCQPCRALVDPPCGAVEHPACLDAIAASAVLTRAVAVLRQSRAVDVSTAPTLPVGP